MSLEELLCSRLANFLIGKTTQNESHYNLIMYNRNFQNPFLNDLVVFDLTAEFRVD
jgi:hypothetical protein